MKHLKIITNLLLALVSMAYPLVWLLLSNTQIVLMYLPYIMAILWGVKALQAVGFERFFAYLMVIVLGVTAFTRTIDIMYWYPVIINGMMLGIFGGSLWRGQPLVERLARLSDPNLPPEAVAYTRKVTQIWCFFFLFNVLLVSTFIFAEYYQYWAIYTGSIAYLLMACLFAGEWIFREFVMRKVDR